MWCVAQVEKPNQPHVITRRDQPETLLRSQIHKEDCVEEVAGHTGQAAWKARHQQVCHALAEASVPLPILNSKPCHVLAMPASHASLELGSFVPLFC